MKEIVSSRDGGIPQRRTGLASHWDASVLGLIRWCRFANHRLMARKPTACFEAWFTGHAHFVIPQAEGLTAISRWLAQRHHRNHTQLQSIPQGCQPLPSP
jgi:hypothetical protein